MHLILHWFYINKQNSSNSNSSGGKHMHTQTHSHRETQRQTLIHAECSHWHLLVFGCALLAPLSHFIIFVLLLLRLSAAAFCFASSCSNRFVYSLLHSRASHRRCRVSYLSLIPSLSFFDSCFDFSRARKPTNCC